MVPRPAPLPTHTSPAADEAHPTTESAGSRSRDPQGGRGAGTARVLAAGRMACERGGAGSRTCPRTRPMLDLTGISTLMPSHPSATEALNAPPQLETRPHRRPRAVRPCPWPVTGSTRVHLADALGRRVTAFSHHRRARPDRQRLLLPLTRLARCPGGGRDRPQANPALPAADQRQGRTLQPHPARRMGLRPPLPIRTRTTRRLPTLAPHLQSPPRTHRARRQTTRQPRPQPHRAIQLARVPTDITSQDAGAGP